jgi:hypothetical protein
MILLLLFVGFWMVLALIALLIWIGLLVQAWGMGLALSAFGISGDKQPSRKLAHCLMGLTSGIAGLLSYQAVGNPLWSLPLLFTVAFMVPLVAYYHPQVAKGASLGPLALALGLFTGCFVAMDFSPETYMATHFGGMITQTSQTTTGSLALGAMTMTLFAFPGTLIAVLRRRK